MRITNWQSLPTIAPQDQNIIQLLSTAFQQNQRLRWLIGERDDFKMHLRFIISFSYKMVKKWRGVYTNPNQSVVLLFYQKSQHYFTWSDVVRYLRIAVQTIGLLRIWAVWKEEQQVKKIRQRAQKQFGDQDYLYVWFLAKEANSQGLKGLVEAKNYILAEAKRRNLPLYIETSDARLLPMYERIGFRFYTQQQIGQQAVTLWFGRCHHPD